MHKSVWENKADTVIEGKFQIQNLGKKSFLIDNIQGIQDMPKPCSKGWGEAASHWLVQGSLGCIKLKMSEQLFVLLLRSISM